MSAKSKHEAVWNWLKGCARIERVFFNFAEADDGNTAFIPSDSLRAEYIDGTQERRYAVELARYLPVSYEADDAGNIAMQEDVDAIADWIRAQAEAGNYPEFPDNCRVTEISVLETEAGYAVAQDGRMAKYMLPFEIDYVLEVEHG